MKQGVVNFILFNIIFFTFSSSTIAQDDSRRNYEIDILRDSFKFNQSTKKSVALDDLYQGCSAVDCIPSIDNPEFITLKDSHFMNDNDVVMMVNYNGIRKLYPRKIMQSHEIVNDHFADKALAMTYCPLCGSAVAFIPIIDDKRVEFGVSGVLHNSDLVMYDRKTKSLWGQITGTAIVGPKTGAKLKSVNVALSRWKNVKDKYPNSLLLAPPKGDNERYTKFHYSKYTQSDKLMFPVSVTDARLNSKRFVYGLEIDGKAIAYEEAYLKKHSPVIESIGDRILQITINDVGEVIAKDKKTNDTFSVLRNYWFAWYSFHPETLLRK